MLPFVAADGVQELGVLWDLAPAPASRRSRKCFQEALWIRVGGSVVLAVACDCSGGRLIERLRIRDGSGLVTRHARGHSYVAVLPDRRESLKP